VTRAQFFALVYAAAFVLIAFVDWCVSATRDQLVGVALLALLVAAGTVAARPRP
jgi:hypothetical protein